MNKLEFITSVEVCGQDDQGPVVHCKIEMLINGVLVESNYDPDVHDIAKLCVPTELDDLDNIYLWTCSCGIPECAGIMPCTVTSFDDHTVTVQVPQPISYSEFADDTNSGYKKWVHTKTIKELKFDLVQLREAVQGLIAQLQEIEQAVNLQTYSGGFNYNKGYVEPLSVSLNTIITSSL